MSIKVGIVGAGLAGRLVALECLQRGWQITLFDQDDQSGKNCCGYVAAGMLAPYTELEASEPLVFQLGLEAATIWPNILKQLIKPVALDFPGTLLVTHPQDMPELARFRSVLQYKLAAYGATSCVMTPISRDKLEDFAPGISPSIREGHWIAHEGHIDTAQFFYSSTTSLQDKKIRWHDKTTVTSIKPHEINVQGNKHVFDLVCDTRGLGARQDCRGLRGIRGELVWLHAPEVKFTCPIRLLHPRYPIYISPRANDVYVVGATSIESEDVSPVSVESLLELLSAAYTVHPGFAEARVINMLTQSRPSFFDQQPKIFYTDGLLKINGLYRHGYMIGPAVIRDALRLLEGGKASMKYSELLNEETSPLCKSL